VIASGNSQFLLEVLVAMDDGFKLVPHWRL